MRFASTRTTEGTGAGYGDHCFELPERTCSQATDVTPCYGVYMSIRLANFSAAL